MTPEEKFMFDLNGYLLVKNVLTPEEVSELTTAAQLHLPATNAPGLDRRIRISNLSKPFQNLIDHPNILPYLITIIESKFRLDHDYSIFMTKDAPGGNLHGGEGHEGDHWYRYRDGVMKNGLTVVTFFLSPAKAGDGGFLCVPGSHKSNFVESIPHEVLTQKRHAQYVIQPEVEAGDALIFTEALVHGTATWMADHERQALLYKFSPGHSAWAQNYPKASDYTDLTERQRRILEPPSVGSRLDVV